MYRSQCPSVSGIPDKIDEITLHVQQSSGLPSKPSPSSRDVRICHGYFWLLPSGISNSSIQVPCLHGTWAAPLLNALRSGLLNWFNGLNIQKSHLVLRKQRLPWQQYQQLKSDTDRTIGRRSVRYSRPEHDRPTQHN